MSLYNTSEFLTLLKEDIGIKDLPLPVDDKELLRRLGQSALKEFSVRSPRVEMVSIGENERLDPDENSRYTMLKYRIPKWAYHGTTILSVPNVDIARPMGYSDMYVPQGSWASPDVVLGALADIQSSASVAATMGRAITHKFVSPDIIYIYNGWAGGIYDVHLAMLHDISLSTISPTAFTHLRQLCVLDLEEFLYNKMKRLDNLEVGIGNIQLKIENWEDAGNRKMELLKDWDENGANLDIDFIRYF